MFDTINMKQAISNLYDAGVVDDTLMLLYEAVKTPSGLTDRQVISVLQGDIFGSVMASVQADNIGQECIAGEHYFL